MALIITPTQEKKIHVQGTEIELPQVYNRLEFSCRPNGIAIEIAFYTYATKKAYECGNAVPTDLPTSNIVVDIDPLQSTQSVESAHELAKTYYEELGYIVEIDLGHVVEIDI
jgi:hypothetical protein